MVEADPLREPLRFRGCIVSIVTPADEEEPGLIPRIVWLGDVGLTEAVALECGIVVASHINPRALHPAVFFASEEQ